MSEPDAVTEFDIDAYIDDELPPARRIEVEAYLCRHPDEAARVFGDLRVRDELRLAYADTAQGGPVQLAQRLQRGLVVDRFMHRARRFAAVALLVGIGWIAHSQFGLLSPGDVAASPQPPAYLTDAIQAHRTSQVRAGMHSQPGVADYDAAEVRASTAIVVPDLPKDWRVSDVQVFPSDFGPSLEMALQAPKLGAVSLFAVRPGHFDVVPATAIAQDELAAAYWQVGDVAYVLVAHAQASELASAAQGLANTTH